MSTLNLNHFLGNSKRSLLLLNMILIILLSAPLAQGKFLGNIYYEGKEPANFSAYWNQVTPENAGKWASVEQERDDMKWSTWLDAAYDYAKEKGFPFKEHCLVWGNQQPDWLNSLLQDEQRAEVEEWIQWVGQTYPDMDLVDVVNEPLHNPPPYKEALGGDGSTGWDWVIWSFEKARQYCSGKLLLNDYGILNSSSNTDKYINLINILKDKGLIDGIGVQGHGLEGTAASTIFSNLDKLERTGLPIYVSEYDVDISDDQQQKQIYKEQFPLFWEHSGVQGVTLWGYIQGEIWKSNAYLVRSGGSERPALVWLMDYLEGKVSSPIIVYPNP